MKSDTLQIDKNIQFYKLPNIEMTAGIDPLSELHCIRDVNLFLPFFTLGALMIINRCQEQARKVL